MGVHGAVRRYGEREPCGTSKWITGAGPSDGDPWTEEWFRQVEEQRYEAEPHIFATAQFTRWAGARILEVGVGSGSDHLQFARAGAECHGVDLTDAAIEATRQHLAMHGLRSRLQRADAASLPFEDRTFDLVYSWGVIHHAEDPKAVVDELHRVLHPGGSFIGMSLST